MHTSGEQKGQRGGRRAAVSLARALSKLGFASRSVAGEWIAAGRARVAGRVVTDSGYRVDMARDRIEVDKEIARTQARVYLAVNKPRGLVTTARDEKDRPTIYECLGAWRSQWLAPVGRLDQASEGLIFFTNDTRWGQRLLDPENHVPRTYHVQISRHLTADELARLREGLELEDGTRTRPANVRVLRQGGKTCWLEIVLTEGLNRQIRRMLAVVGVEVMRLVRVAIGPIELGDLPKGGCRPLTVAELASLDQAMGRDIRP